MHFQISLQRNQQQGDEGQPDSSALTTTAVVSCVPVGGASFIFAPSVPRVGQSVVFTATATGAAPLTYLWDFGDASPTENGAIVNHIFPLSLTAIEYTVTPTVSNACPSQQVAAGHVTVQPYRLYVPLIFKNIS